MSVRTTRLAWNTPNGTHVETHQSTGLSTTHPWLPSAVATARIDRDARHADIGTVEANIMRCGGCGPGYHLTWSAAQGGTSETFLTIRAALKRMGEVAVAELALNPTHLDFGSGQHGCL